MLMGKILSCVFFIAMTPVALFAESAKENVGSSAAHAVGFLPPLLSGFVVSVILCVVAIIVCFLFGKQISDHFKIVVELKKQLVPKDNTLIKHQITSIQNQVHDLIMGQNNSLRAINSLSESLSSLELVSVLSSCFEKTADIKNELAELLNLTPELINLNKQMQNLIEKKPDLVNLSIDNAVEFLKQCHSEGISSVEQITEMHKIAEQYKIAQFASYSEMLESKKYYDMRNSHEKMQKESEGKIQNMLFSLTDLQQKLQSLKNDCSRLEKENETLRSKENELEQARFEKNLFQQKLQSLCPENIIPIDALSSLLQDSAPALKSETLTLITQLYWFSQLFRNTPAKIKAAFTKFDETLYELFAEKQEFLQSIRRSIQDFVNEEVFKDTSYKMEWPALNSSVSEHEDLYYRENNEGNRICRVCNAIIINSGKIETRAKISTTI